ncbi:MAG: CDGSH iron-sulfur domain-containing protein [Rickettsiales bacterium]|jgi:CDGSH-type Zn-finger protein|nr:CDGSH iron-sulfur domain-containing protein [Rickettsiales bacterium]
MAKKIKIIKNGPYEVSGGIPLSKKEIAMTNQGVLGLKKIKDYQPENPETYHLCRCGRSKTAPFCDGSHTHGFEGTEVADRRKYDQRAEVQKGPDLDLQDDNRCAFARFCHRQRAEVWTLTAHSDDPENRREAIEGITECPAGRLVARDKDGNIIEKHFEPEIEIVEDPQRNCSAGIYVKGNIPIESADGKMYEVRNRAALCRCGHSRNTPFCDATHVGMEFDDEEQK